MKRVVLTYGTFDLFHVGHLKLLTRLRSLGDELIVGVSTDEFNAEKGKKTVIPFHDRVAIIEGLRCVDKVIPERAWEQKKSDILKLNVTTFGMGHDWQGKFDELKEFCEVVYLPRTEGISSTQIKGALKTLNKDHIEEFKSALDAISAIVKQLE